MKNTLSPKARAFLQERRFAVLGTINRDGTPQLSTMWYLLEGDTIMMNTKVGRVKERNMRRDPRISLCFEEGYNYVTVSGKVEFIDDQQTAQADIYRLAVRYDGEESAQRQMQESFGKEQRVTLHLKFDHVIEHFEE
ncbi:MAG TPA: PPOX class F420-dependent oxidoreductase [Ktedonobacteraceae bacterium]|nr:PPOX class F420-dependent oxidoreductase [Ktedonobacteraceae bacterium]